MPKKKPIPESTWTAIRALYESPPGISIAQLARKYDAVGITKDDLIERRDAEGWKQGKMLQDNALVNARAHAIADEYSKELADLGDDITEEDVARATDRVVAETAAAARAEIIDRHRREWKLINNLLTEQLRERANTDKAFAKAKLTKITAETIKIKQEGERKAWGIDQIEDPSTTIVVERD